MYKRMGSIVGQRIMDNPLTLPTRLVRNCPYCTDVERHYAIVRRVLMAIS